MMNLNETLKSQIIDIVKQQLNENEPPETQVTFNKLKNQGFSESEAMKLIGKCVTVEILGTYNHGTIFNKQRFAKNLSNLPNEPVEV